MGIQPGAEQAEIKIAYRKRALEVHPDVSSALDANERFAEISNAYGERILQVAGMPRPAWLWTGCFARIAGTVAGQGLAASMTLAAS